VFNVALDGLTREMFDLWCGDAVTGELIDCDAVMKHHMIKGHRCDVRKALSKEEMRDSRFSSRGW